jgi:hypothetical protein
VASILRKWLVRLEPAVNRRTLAVLSGVVWWAVGLGLVIAAARWLNGVPRDHASLLAAAGLLAAVLAGYGFRRIAAKNLRRLAAFPDRRCVFAFQSWRGYGTILLMITLGWGLRHSPVPKPWLVPVYLAMGGALMRGGVEYFRWNPDRTDGGGLEG